MVYRERATNRGRTFMNNIKSYLENLAIENLITYGEYIRVKRSKENEM